MASGNQVKSGNWALLPMIPPKMRMAERLSRAGDMRAAISGLSISRMLRLPRCSRTRRMPDKECHIPGPRHDKGLLAGLAGTEFFIPEADQEIGRQPDQFPEDIELEHGGRDSQAHHRPDKKRHEGVIARKSRVASHVAQGIDLDEKADEGHDGEHEQTDRIKKITQMGFGYRSKRARAAYIGAVLSSSNGGKEERWRSPEKP